MLIAENLETCDPVLAFDRIMEENGIERYPAVIRTAYAQAVSAGNQAEAEALSARMDRVAAGFPCPQEIRRERELMRRIQPEDGKGG